MLRRSLLLSVLFLVFQQNGFACDACGCSISGGGIGLLANYKKNFVALNWSGARFVGSPLHGSGGTDIFNTVELSLRFHISKRFKVQLNQPYRYNTRRIGENSDGRSGISDTRIVATYAILKDWPISKRIRLYFEVGGGIKLPLGAYDKDIQKKNLPENFNVGNGSWGYLFQPNLLLTRYNLGLIINGFFQLNEKTKDGYHFGNQTAIRTAVFYDAYLGKGFSIAPAAGVYYERIGQDRYAFQSDVPGTGGRGTFLQTGTTFKYKQWSYNFTYSFPLKQSYSEEAVDARGRISTQITYLF